MPRKRSSFWRCQQKESGWKPAYRRRAAACAGRRGLMTGIPVWSKYSNAQRVSSLHLSEGCLNLASRSDTYFFRVRSSLPAARPAADLSQPCAPPVGLSPPPAAQGSEASPAARNTLDSARIPRASKLLICGLFQKGRVLAQDGVVAKREISGFDVGGSWWFRKSEIDQWTAGNAVGPDDIGEPVERKQ